MESQSRWISHKKEFLWARFCTKCWVYRVPRSNFRHWVLRLPSTFLVQILLWHLWYVYMKNWVTPKQYSCSQNKAMNCARERKSHSQILNLKCIFGTEISKSKGAFSWSLTLSLTSLAAEVDLFYSILFTHFPIDQFPSLQYCYLQPLCFLGSAEDEETECSSVTIFLQV